MKRMSCDFLVFHLTAHEFIKKSRPLQSKSLDGRLAFFKVSADILPGDVGNVVPCAFEGRQLEFAEAYFLQFLFTFGHSIVRVVQIAVSQGASGAVVDAIRVFSILDAIRAHDAFLRPDRHPAHREIRPFASRFVDSLSAAQSAYVHPEFIDIEIVCHLASERTGPAASATICISQYDRSHDLCLLCFANIAKIIPIDLMRHVLGFNQKNWGMVAARLLEFELMDADGPVILGLLGAQVAAQNGWRI